MIEGTVKINGYWYNLASKVVGAYHSRLPGKVNTGDDSFDKEQFLSNWIITGHKYGGIGIDEMVGKVHADRCFWTNCIEEDGHILLPRLATAITDLDGGTVTPTYVRAISATDSSAGEWTDIANTYDANTATFAITVGTSDGQYLILSFAAQYSGRLKILWDRSAAQNVTCKVDVHNMYDGSWTNVINTTGAGSSTVYEEVNITDGYYDKVRIHKTSSEYLLRVYDVMLETAQPSSSGTLSVKAGFNGELYKARGKYLLKLSSDRTNFLPIAYFPADITDMFTGPNNNLLIFLGDPDEYWYMSTDEVLDETDVSDATRGVLWDSKAWKMDADGNWWYTATPNAASPTWTSRTGIADIASQVERLEVGKDGDGDPVIYCSTNTWLKVYDFTNNKWINTEVKLYGNQYHGQGFAYWNAAHYLSYGLGVKQYTVGSTGALSDVGLNRDGGLPAEYNGIIVKMANGGDQLFLLVDASLVTGNSQSGLYAFNGRSLKCWWADSNNNGAMHDVIVTARSSDYAVYWDCGTSIYYIDIPQGVSNPKYLAGTQEYATSGIYLSPWFDGGNQAFQKLAKAVVSYAKGITTTETIVIKYRTDKTYTDRDSGWTTLDTLNTTGENGEKVNQIATGAGTGFNSFQFRLDLARGSTTTLSPDMLALTLGHRLISQGNWSWTMTLDIPDELSNNTTGAQKWANLESAIESATDIPFIFRDEPEETHYVQFVNPREILAAGKSFAGQITISLLESWLP